MDDGRYPSHLAHEKLGMITKSAIYCLCCTIMFASCVFGQQDYVGRFDLFNGFTWFDSPSAKLQQRGYHLQAGINANTWLALGFDYSVAQGNLTLTPDLLKTPLQTQIAAQLSALKAAGLIPANYQLAVTTASTTQTFAAGPQLEYRRFQRITLFIRPSIGAIHESATPRPSDAISTTIIQRLAPSGTKTDWQAFYGFGGGADLNFFKHASIRLQADFVHNDLFSDILKNSRNTVRLSIGPAFHLGRNVVR
jgi:hypothetical protein